MFYKLLQIIMFITICGHDDSLIKSKAYILTLHDRYLSRHRKVSETFTASNRKLIFLQNS